MGKMTGKPYGSLIGLKEEATGQYILLHRNVFPEVLEQIAKSSIANYSIYLLNGMLFGFFEYIGEAYEEDMAEMGKDLDTQQWWKLTEPMQKPLDSRKEGEWWSSMNHLYSYSVTERGDYQFFRRGFRIISEKINSEIDFKDFLLRIPGIIKRAELFSWKSEHYLYIEITGDQKLSHNLFKSFHWEEMEEVFHTDGCAVNRQKKVFVTGCFDMLHSGHVAFLAEAASFGNLYVGIGSDANINHLKGRYPTTNEQERKYMLESVRFVHRCTINKGWGIMDFLMELEEIRPDIFIVNEDGHTPQKLEICNKLGIEYKVLKRIPHTGMPVRSTTVLRTECRIPFRIDLAGGWLDQPFVSRYFPGPVLTISIEPTLDFNDRSGMASSTRRKAIELWKTDIPPGDPELLAKMLFSYDNPPGTTEVSGSQDSLGIVMPGLSRLDYSGSYWPDQIISVTDDETLKWLENHLFLVNLGPRTDQYNVLSGTRVNKSGAKRLSEAATHCWDAVLAKDLPGFGQAFRESFEAQVAMFPNMASDHISLIICQYKGSSLGWKLSGAGGGGYLILVAEQPIPGAIRIKIRRNNE